MGNIPFKVDSIGPKKWSYDTEAKNGIFPARIAIIHN